MHYFTTSSTLLSKNSSLRPPLCLVPVCAFLSEIDCFSGEVILLVGDFTSILLWMAFCGELLSVSIRMHLRDLSSSSFLSKRTPHQSNLPTTANELPFIHNSTENFLPKRLGYESSSRNASPFSSLSFLPLRQRFPHDQATTFFKPSPTMASMTMARQGIPTKPWEKLNYDKPPPKNVVELFPERKKRAKRFVELLKYVFKRAFFRNLNSVGLLK